MYGGIYAFRHTLDNAYRSTSITSPSPLSTRFDETYFRNLLSGEKKNITAKALLATEQRILGVGNGILQDILFNVSVHPKRKIRSLTNKDIHHLFLSIKSTLQAMTEQGGRDTETDLFGHHDNYQMILSKNSHPLPCLKCGGAIIKEAYMGEFIYYCPNCQPIE